VYILTEIQLREEILSQIGSTPDLHRSIERYMLFVTQLIAFASYISTSEGWLWAVELYFLSD